MGARREEAGREEGTLEAPGAPGGLQRPLDGQKLPEHTKTLIPDPRPQTSADMIPLASRGARPEHVQSRRRGASWEPLGGLLGASWRPLGSFFGPLGDFFGAYPPSLLFILPPHLPFQRWL